MARRREFDSEEVLERATRLFWEKGYAATSTDELLQAMGIGRQSLYNAFGDKHGLYLEVIRRYGQQSLAQHITNLNRPRSPRAGLEALLLGLLAPSEGERRLGCLGVNSVCEFGDSDAALGEIRASGGQVLRRAVLERVQQALAAGELSSQLEAGETADFVLMTMQGIQLGARAGAPAKELQKMARFAIARLS